MTPAIKLTPGQAAELRYWVKGLAWGRPRNPRPAQTKLAKLGLLTRISANSPLYVATEAGRAWIATNTPKEI